MNLAVLISGRGSNFSSLVDAQKKGQIGVADIKILISNKASAKGIDYAKENKIPFFVLRDKDWESEIVELLEKYKIQLVCLAGFMRIISPRLINFMKGWIVNIHPSLLPAFPGLNVHKRVLESGFPFSGCTVHWVDEGVDTGPIIDQRVTPVLKEDTEEALSSRILKEEHRLYPSVVKKIADGNLVPFFTEEK
ncbi:phosphoribosylglycinamide formyltransferase [bacterium]|jgi:phosphoribosylglycinamide formyltransferase-1|nr:phosphoribosylglycinamide formyltransferase [bacterium]|tara:strand:- start:383 stop:961 length:579 start_codon:yes stop_codon:yes gene_type:complete